MQRLDEVQSYVLLRRWQTDNRGDILSSQLTAAQLESLMDFYANERSYIAVCQRLLIPLSQSKAARRLPCPHQHCPARQHACHIFDALPCGNAIVTRGPNQCAGNDGSEVAKVCQSALEGLQSEGLHMMLLQTAVDNLSPKAASVQQSQTGRYRADYCVTSWRLTGVLWTCYPLTHSTDPCLNTLSTDCDFA